MLNLTFSLINDKKGASTISCKYHILYVERKISDRNFCGIRFSADFPANFVKFQILSKRSIFVAQKHLLYEIASKFNEENDENIIK